MGIAYSVTPKTVVRTGYGIFFTQFTQMFYPGWGGGVAQDGFYAIPSFGSTNNGLTAAFLLQNGLPQNFARPPFIDPSYLNGQGGPNYRPFDSNRRPYAQPWNLTIEHEFTNNFYFNVGYVGNKGTRLPSQTLPINAISPQYLSMGQKLYDQFGPNDMSVTASPPPTPAGPVKCRLARPRLLRPSRPYCNLLYGLTENAGNSTYHAFQAKVEKRFSNGLWMLTSYTSSKTIDNTDNTQVTATLGSVHGVISPFQRERNKALAVDDVPQVLSQSFIYDLPFGKGKRWGANLPKFVNGLLGGWSLSSVFRISSGVPLFFRSSYCNVPGQFVSYCIPGILPGANPWAQSKSNFNPDLPLFNQSAFENYNNFNFYAGVGPRVSNLRGFGYHNHDVGLIKDIRITERLNLQLRGEFFNIWNWHTFNCSTQCFGAGAFGNSVGDPTFGMWNGSVTSPRNIQVVGRLTF